MDVLQLLDSAYKIVSVLASIGILWGVWKVAWWVQKVESHITQAESEMKSQGSLLQQATSNIAMIMGKLFGPKFGSLKK